MWHVTHDTWHMPCRGLWTFCQYFRFLALTVWELQSKGPIYSWYNHYRKAAETGEIPRSTNRQTTTVPSFDAQHFLYGPTPRRPVVGQDNMDLKVLQQQQQMTVIMVEILKMKNWNSKPILFWTIQMLNYQKLCKNHSIELKILHYHYHNI